MLRIMENLVRLINRDPFSEKAHLLEYGKGFFWPDLPLLNGWSLWINWQAYMANHYRFAFVCKRPGTEIFCTEYVLLQVFSHG